MALDGNSIGGLLIEVFGAEMTAAQTICATCGAAARSRRRSSTCARRAPWCAAAPARSVLMVIAQVRGCTRRPRRHDRT